MAFDPTHARREAIDNVPYPYPSIYQLIDAIGINVVITGIQVSGIAIDTCTAVFNPNINTPGIYIVSGSPRDPQHLWHVSGDNLDYGEGYLDYYSQAIAIKKTLGKWIYAEYNGGSGKVRPIQAFDQGPSGITFYGSWENDNGKSGHNDLTIQGQQIYNTGMVEELFGGTYIPDFYGTGNHFRSKLCERLQGGANNTTRHLKVRLKLRLEDDINPVPTATTLPSNTQTLFKVKIWESDASWPNSNRDADVVYSGSINSMVEDIFGSQMDPEEGRLLIENYQWLEDSQLEAVFDCVQGGVSRQLNIQFYICSTSFLSENYAVKVLIDEIEVYDEIGEEIVKPFWGSTPQKISDDPNNSFDAYDRLNRLLTKYNDLDTGNKLVAFEIDEPREESVWNTVMIDGLFEELTPEHRYYSNRPWGHNEWPDTGEQWWWLDNQGSRNYYDDIIDYTNQVISGDEPSVVRSMIYPLREPRGSTPLQTELDEFIGYEDLSSQDEVSLSSQGLYYLLWLQQQNSSIKPVVLIQCMHDYGGFEHRNPYNMGEIYVQGYLVHTCIN